MRIRIQPYKKGSASAKSLSRALGGKVLRLKNSKYRYKPGDIILNWGNSSPIEHTTGNGNKYEIEDVIDKLRFFRQYEGTGLTPEFWENVDDIPDSAFESGVVCRTILRGSSGRGIVICNSRADCPDARLYVKYEKKKDEYRVHLGRTYYEQPGEDPTTSIIDLRKKGIRAGLTPVSWQVRNHGNGFIYLRHGFETPPEVVRVATQAFILSGLDYGAVDVIYNEAKNKAYVLEINTAPGLEGATLEAYKRYFLG